MNSEWIIVSGPQILRATGLAVRATAVFAIGALVEWSYRSGTGYGRVVGYASRGADHEHTQYRVHVFYRHRSADGTLEPATRIHWGTSVRRQPRAVELARADFKRYQGTKREGVLAI